MAEHAALEELQHVTVTERCVTVQHSEGILMLSVSRWKKM